MTVIIERNSYNKIDEYENKEQKQNQNFPQILSVFTCEGKLYVRNSDMKKLGCFKDTQPLNSFIEVTEDEVSYLKAKFENDFPGVRLIRKDESISIGELKCYGVFDKKHIEVINFSSLGNFSIDLTTAVYDSDHDQIIVFYNNTFLKVLKNCIVMDFDGNYLGFIISESYENLIERVNGSNKKEETLTEEEPTDSNKKTFV